MTDYSDFMKKAFEQGLMSDVRMKAFNKTYKLHKLQLSRSPFFQALFNSNSLSDQVYQNGIVSEYLLSFPNQPLITQKCFELSLRRFYNCEDLTEESKIPVSMFIIGHLFNISSCIHDSSEFLFKKMTNDQALLIIKNFCDRERGEYKYGELGFRLLASAKLKLHVFGWSDGASKWDGVPGSMIVQIVSNSMFEVPNDYYRSRFILDLLKRRWSDRTKKIKNKQNENLLKNDIKVIEKYMEWLYQAKLTTDERIYFQAYRKKNGIWGPKSNFLYSFVLTLSIIVGMLLIILFIICISCFILICMGLFLSDNWECLVGAIVFTPVYRLITCSKTKKKTKEKLENETDF